MKVAIFDTGVSNIASVVFALNRIGLEPQVIQDARALSTADRVILPGVGNAKASMKIIQERNAIDPIRSLTCPVLGICLGMQLLFDHSEEGNVSTLGIIAGQVIQFRDHFFAGRPLAVPHLGWNQVNFCQLDPIIHGIPNGSDFYFVHSFHATSVLPDSLIATTEYGVMFPAIVRHKNFCGTQFHPERSGLVGEQLLKNFIGASP